MANVMDLSRHPRRVLDQIRRFATQDVNNIEYRCDINAILKGESVFMAEIWECLEHGDVMEEHLHFEESGTYAKLVCHTSDASIFVDIHMLKTESKLRVLYATKEES